MEVLMNENARSNQVGDLDRRDDLSLQHPQRPETVLQTPIRRSRRVDGGDDADDAHLFDILEEDEEEEEGIEGSGSYRFKVEHCAQCHAPSDFFCGRCCDAASSARLSGTKTSYCSTSCQLLHFERHEPACNILAKRKALEKVAKLLCSIWRKIRAKAYPFNVTQVGQKDGMLAVHQGDERRNMKGRIFFDAPELTLETPQIREQILLMGSSRTSIALLHLIVKELFSELGCEYIKEITVPVVDPIVHYDSDGNERDWTEPIAHVVFEIRLRDAESWVLDLTAAAIGRDYFIRPWREWTDMTEQGYEEHPLGHQAAQLNYVRSDMNLAFIYTHLHYLSLKMIPERFKTKLEATGVFLKDLHKATDEHFPHVQENILRHLDLAIEEWAEFMALPQTMDDIGSIFKKLAISTMGEQAVRDDLRKLKDRGRESRVGVEHEILRVFRDKRVLSDEDRVIHDVMRDMFFA